MVKAGTNKKRRSGRTGRTQLKNKNFNRWDPNPKITNAVIRKNWDPSKSPSVNMANMGLLAQPNAGATKAPAEGDSEVKKVITAVELFDIPDSDVMGKKTNKMPLSLDDQKYIAKCMSKYGEDYKKMFRDIKVNKMQHTEEKLRKMGARFLLLSEVQRLVEVPNKVKNMVDN